MPAMLLCVIPPMASPLPWYAWPSQSLTQHSHNGAVVWKAFGGVAFCVFNRIPAWFLRCVGSN